MFARRCLDKIHGTLDIRFAESCVAIGSVLSEGREGAVNEDRPLLQLSLDISGLS